MQTSKRGVALIKKHEGLRLTAYLCPAGVPTIGYGHTLSVTHEDVAAGKTISEERASLLLLQDLQRFERGVLRVTTAPLNQNQFDAFVSFAFNIGLEGFSSSTALELHNTGAEPPKVVEAMFWWKGGGRPWKALPGLVKRRAEEGALYEEPPAPFSDEDPAGELFRG